MSGEGFQTVAIVGVGLIGASFGLALKKAGFGGRILGVSSPSALAEALQRGAIDESATLEEAAGRAELVFLAQPIQRILETLTRLDPLLRAGALVTDAGSTKRRIVTQAEACIRRGQFLGGHPMAGKEKRGAAEADADLFVGRTWVLTPRHVRELQTAGVREYLRWIRAIGATPLVMDPDEHDRTVALTSHLPQLLSTALAATLQQRLPHDDALRVAGPGLLDMTRLAASPFEIWRDILATNSDAIALALDAFAERLAALRRNLGGESQAADFEDAARLARRLRRRE